MIELITAILALAAAIIALLKKRRKGRKSMKPNNKIEQTSADGGVNISANHGGQIIIAGSNTNNADDSTASRECNTNQELDHNSDLGDFDMIQLERVYTSLFVEDNQLKTERIIINNQDHEKVEGVVELDEIDTQGRKKRTLSYNLNGLFANKILTGEYVSKGSRSDERGAINLKLIGTDILSGFCSFSKLTAADDEIRVSPYVWVAGENVDLLDGTYDFCTNCYLEKVVCCCASEEIDMPLFLDSEKNRIRSKLDRRKQSTKSYSTPLPAPYDQTSVRQILREEKQNGSGELESKCHFFDMYSKHCKIYDSRPIDCRLFPFDIKLSSSKNEYIIGYYPDLCMRPLPDHNTMVRYAHILRPYFFLLYPYLHIYTSDEVCQRLKNAEFKKIASFQDFIF